VRVIDPPAATSFWLVNNEGNDRSAVIRFTYLLNAKNFSIRKEVGYEDEDQFFERNSFDWKR